MSAGYMPSDARFISTFNDLILRRNNIKPGDKLEVVSAGLEDRGGEVRLCFELKRKSDGKMFDLAGDFFYDSDGQDTEDIVFQLLNAGLSYDEIKSGLLKAKIDDADSINDAIKDVQRTEGGK